MTETNANQRGLDCVYNETVFKLRLAEVLAETWRNLLIVSLATHITSSIPSIATTSNLSVSELKVHCSSMRSL